MSRTTVNPLTRTQMGYVLNDIAAQAAAIRRMVIMTREMEDDRDIEAAAQCVESLAERVGFLADMAADRMGGSEGPFVGDALQWMMPPTFHEEEKQVPQGMKVKS